MKDDYLVDDPQIAHVDKCSGMVPTLFTCLTI
jgi:hypothetical protein